MSKEKDLGSFKISDAVKRPVTPSSASQLASGNKKKGGREETPSVGFPNIEHVIEADALDKAGLHARRDALEELARGGDTKQKSAARKALAAYQEVEGLLDFLWDTKEKLGSGGQEAAPAPAPSKPSGGKGKKK